ncbi:hypothetical protein AA313_de0203439 [Arthrobotrys entomopaga]|nr:hypothetical protein AA313_de0203439 [Arthrobotrys entomopaga]
MENLDFSPIAAQLTKLTISLHAYTYHGKDTTGLLPCFKLFNNLVHLSINTDNPFVELGKLLNNLPRLKHLCFSVNGYGRYYLTESERQKAPIGIVDFLEAQTSSFKLQTLTLRGENPRDFIPGQLVGKYFSELEDFAVSTGYLLSGPGVEAEGTIWDGFRLGSVRLRKVEVELWGPSPPLLRYLESYQGTLGNLRIRPPPFTCTNQTIEADCNAHQAAVEDFFEKLWGNVIPAHKSSLKQLYIMPGSQHGGIYGSRQAFMDDLNEREPWRITDAAETALLMCEKLERFEIGHFKMRHLKRAVGVAVKMPALKTFVYHIGGLERPPNYTVSWLDSTGEVAQEILHFRKEVMAIRWDGGDVPEERWTGLDVSIIPLDKARLEKEKRKSAKGMWKVVDSLSNLRELTSLMY